ncbi:DsbA family protein [Arthrobacter sp. CJ23]|uniref:DsbA family protein n=1 Tax=Arthrobacter sp. CJ23 TaxID=2972479 RepID=UPI00215C913A|nr:DsbA family protein [Arthrobacter sp. CJ23]UVJ40205.1 DsbA family protein [Arthrobacter sp. CJ23]
MTTTKASPPDTARKAHIAIWILLAAVVGAGAIWFAVLAGGKAAPDAPPPAAQAQLVRDDSHRTTSPAAEKAQLVEFLDYECGPCRALDPLVEELKKEFGDRITFISRNYPLPFHRNATPAALATEAAARQDKYGQMHTRLFDTQPQWGDSQDSQAPLFRNFARELGLDLAAYDAAVADPRAAERIQRDVADGKALGVNGTPTFFLDGKKLTLTSAEQFRQLLAEAAK